MRHDPAGAAIVIMLRSLKMPGMAQAVHDLVEQGAPAFDAAIPILSQLLKAEMAEREVRSIAYHMNIRIRNCVHVFLEQFEAIPLAVNHPQRDQLPLEFFKRAIQCFTVGANALVIPCCRVDYHDAIRLAIAQVH